LWNVLKQCAISSIERTSVKYLLGGIQMEECERKSREPRYRVDAMSVMYEAEAKYWSAPVVNISGSGLLLSTAHQMPVGTEIALTPTGPNLDGLPFELRGQVARLASSTHASSTDPAMALRWVSQDDQIAKQLQTFLKVQGTEILEASA